MKGVFFMNDKAITVLDNYDIDVKKTYKGRGTILCDTNAGVLVLKEYKGSLEKLELLNRLQNGLKAYVKTDMLIRNKAGEFFCKDSDGAVYILKEFIEGRECNYKNEEDIMQAFEIMAKLHKGMTNPEDSELFKLPFHSYADEMEKHTRECRRIYNYICKLKKRTEFERALLHEYGYFLELAEEVTKKAKAEDMKNYEHEINRQGFFYHGDYQYHNVISAANTMCVINLEHFGKDSGVRDLYLLFRKISEKTEWSLQLGERMISAYEKNRTLQPFEWKQFIYRLSYPDKFWKIVNFYYNSKKSWIPDKNREKLEMLINQETAKRKMIEMLIKK